MLNERRLVRRLISDLHLRPLADEVNRAIRTWHPAIMSRNARIRRNTAPSDPPLPPLKLVYKVAHTGDLDWFLRSGALTAQGIRSALNDIGRPLEGFANVLDYGCGCGRVLRHWRDVKGPRFVGCDYNPEFVAWVRANLPFVTAVQNDLAPPLPFEDGAFDLVYANSVFTHWPEALQSKWMAELRRVLRPTGILLMTTLGAYFAPTMFKREREGFDAGRLVVRDQSLPGTNLCLAFHPETYVRSLAAASNMDMRLFQPAGALGSPGQDQWLLEKRGT